MLYLHFPLILVTILNLISALEFRTYICVHNKSLTRFSTWCTRSDHFYFFYEAVGGPKVWSGQRTKSVIAVFEWLKIISTICKFFWIIENFLMIANCYWSWRCKTSYILIRSSRVSRRAGQIITRVGWHNAISVIKRAGYRFLPSKI